jgi:hypothetical protein
VYAIRTKGAEYVKVGMAVDVDSRLRQMQTGSAHRLWVYMTSEQRDASGMERELHRKLKQWNVQDAGGREWFHWCKDVRQILRCNLANAKLHAMPAPHPSDLIRAAQFTLDTALRDGLATAKAEADSLVEMIDSVYVLLYGASRQNAPQGKEMLRYVAELLASHPSVRARVLPRYSAGMFSQADWFYAECEATGLTCGGMSKANGDWAKHVRNTKSRKGADLMDSYVKRIAA